MCVGRHHGSLVGVGAIGNELDGRSAAQQVVGKVFAEDQHQAGVALLEDTVYVVRPFQVSYHGEVCAGPETLGNAQRHVVLRGVVERHPRVVQLCLDGIAQQEHEHQGHPQEDEQRPPVAEDLAKLFQDKGKERFHGRVALLANCWKTSSMLPARYCARRFFGESKASIRPSTMMETRSQYSASSM